MANELKRAYHGTTLTLESNGASVASAALGTADDANYNLATYGDYPHARLVLTTNGYSGTPTVSGTVEVIVRPLNIDGTSDAVAPQTDYRHQYVGAFVLDNAAGTGELYYVDCYDLPREGTVYLYNGCGAQLSTGWTLKFNAFTFAPT